MKITGLILLTLGLACTLMYVHDYQRVYLNLFQFGNTKPGDIAGGISAAMFWLYLGIPMTVVGGMLFICGYIRSCIAYYSERNTLPAADK